MNNIIDVQILTQTHFDSGALSGLGAVVHRVLQPGDHRLTVLRADNPIQAMSLRVLPPAAAAQPSATPQPSELHVNLGQVLGPLGRLAPRPPAANLEMPAQGYALFHAPPDEAGFAVQLHAPGTENQPPSFDSRQLDNTDVYATPLLRPGRYSVTNVATGAKGEIRVSYPVIGDKPYRPPDPFEVQVTDGLPARLDPTQACPRVNLPYWQHPGPHPNRLGRAGRRAGERHRCTASGSSPDVPLGEANIAGAKVRS